jgi:hypothetical protein
MRDAFLIFLMLVTAVLLYGMVAVLRWGFSDPVDEGVAFMASLGAGVLLGAAAFLLLVVGHAVGVDVPGLGW